MGGAIGAGNVRPPDAPELFEDVLDAVCWFVAVEAAGEACFGLVTAFGVSWTTGLGFATG